MSVVLGLRFGVCQQQLEVCYYLLLISFQSSFAINRKDAKAEWLIEVVLRSDPEIEIVEIKTEIQGYLDERFDNVTISDLQVSRNKETNRSAREERI